MVLVGLILWDTLEYVRVEWAVKEMFETLGIFSDVFEPFIVACVPARKVPSSRTHDSIVAPLEDS